MRVISPVPGRRVATSPVHSGGPRAFPGHTLTEQLQRLQGLGNGAVAQQLRCRLAVFFGLAQQFIQSVVLILLQALVCLVQQFLFLFGGGEQFEQQRPLEAVVFLQ